MFQPTLRFSHYRILRREDGSPWRLGVGAMGVTYKAFDERLRVEVALKVIAPHKLHDPRVQALFLREARAAARVRHTNVASVLALDDTAGSYSYAMEFVAGPTLEEQLRLDRRYSPAVAFALAAQIARGLEAIHAQGIVHRDLKPANLMLSRPRTGSRATEHSGGWLVKIIDFGLARAFEGEGFGEEGLGQSVGFRGTVLYASPEQCQERTDLDGRADLYALGCILWELLTGDLPFRARSQHGLMNEHVSTPPPRERLTGLSPDAQAVVLKLLEKDRAARFANADLAADALERCAESARASDAPALPEPTEPPAPRSSFSAASAASAPAWEATLFETPRRRRWLEGAACAVVLLAVGGVFWLRYQREARAANASGAATTALPVLAAADRADLARIEELIDGSDNLPEEFQTAEDLAKALLARRPGSDEAALAMARVQTGWLMRGFDRTEERYAEAKRWVDRAYQASPEDPERKATLAIYLSERRMEFDWALDLLRSAVAAAPGEPRYRFALSSLLVVHPRARPGEALAVAQEAVERFPNHPLAHYSLARRYRELNQLDKVTEALDRSIALAPLTNAITWRARLILFAEGDWRRARALLERVTPRRRTLERVIAVRVDCALIGGDSEDGLEALKAVLGTWMQDFAYTGPKSLLTAALLEVGGKPDLARLQYEAALAELRPRAVRSPDDPRLRLLEIWTLRGLGRIEEAKTLLRAHVQSIPRPFRLGYVGSTDNSWFGFLPCCLLLGERSTALMLAQEAAAAPEERRVLEAMLRIDPRLAAWRADPELAALVAPPRQEPLGGR
ncbi:MAG: protein kinase [Verrucomicrobia bacterium]|nr:protein kinase [Verrucomicrobiota bacterium]